MFDLYAYNNMYSLVYIYIYIYVYQIINNIFQIILMMYMKGSLVKFIQEFEVGEDYLKL